MAVIEISHAILPEKLEIQEEVKKFLEKLKKGGKSPALSLTLELTAQEEERSIPFMQKLLLATKFS